MDLKSEISYINDEIKRRNLPMAELTVEHFEFSLHNHLKFLFPKSERKSVLSTLETSLLKSNQSLYLTVMPEYNIYRVNFGIDVSSDKHHEYMQIPMVDGVNLSHYSPEEMAGCSTSPNLCAEPLFHTGSFQQASTRVARFPYRVEEIRLNFTKKQYEERPEIPKGFTQNGLKVWIKITDLNIPLIIDYFGFGQDRENLRKILMYKVSLGLTELDLKEIMPPAVNISLNHFPSPSEGEFDVCYNAASTFFNINHKHGNNSPELLESIINHFYCKRDKYKDMRFGDILYIGGHAVRYIMYDSFTNKHIVYQMNSGGYDAWRFIYLEEAFEFYNYKTQIAESSFYNLYDAYYKCK